MADTIEARVFADASVVVAATLSPNGGSRVIFNLSKVGLIKLILTEEIVKEARLSIKKKYGKEKLLPFYHILGDLKENIYPTPSDKEIEAFTKIITDKKDRHVLAGAEKYQADVLVTLDKQHFFTEIIRSSKLSFNIQLPGDYLESYRQH